MKGVDAFVKEAPRNKGTTCWRSAKGRLYSTSKGWMNSLDFNLVLGWNTNHTCTIITLYLYLTFYTLKCIYNKAITALVKYTVNSLSLRDSRNMVGLYLSYASHHPTKSSLEYIIYLYLLYTYIYTYNILIFTLIICLYLCL